MPFDGPGRPRMTTAAVPVTVDWIVCSHSTRNAVVLVSSTAIRLDAVGASAMSAMNFPAVRPLPIDGSPWVIVTLVSPVRSNSRAASRSKRMPLSTSIRTFDRMVTSASMVIALAPPNAGAPGSRAI